MTPLETEADPNIRVGPLRWVRPDGSLPSVSFLIFFPKFCE